MPPGSDSDDEDDHSNAQKDAVTNLLARCTELKESGNANFKKGDCSSAIMMYEMAVHKLTADAAKKALKAYFSSCKDAVDTASPLLASLQGNMAACHIKLEQWEKAAKSATAALDLEPSNVKARFRRGLARSHLKEHDEAKSDLTAVVKADPKNREARTVLESVNAAIKSRTSSEKGMFAKAFAGPSLYADEAAKAAKAAKAAADAKAAEEVELTQEWRDECDALRKLSGAPNPEVERLAALAKAGDFAEAQRQLDALAPISLEEFRAAKAKALAKEMQKHNAEAAKAEAERKASAERLNAQLRTAVSDVTTLEADDAEEAALLSGLSKGYKTRADGSKTSYFDRSEHVDASVKALLDAQKAPKRLDTLDISDGAASSAGPVGAGAGAAPAAAAAPASVGGGSVWNVGGTYEEKDVSKWAIGELTQRLEAVAIRVGKGELRVDKVVDCEGHASIVANRGKVKRPFELKCDVKWSFADGDPAHGCAGTIAYADVSPAPTGNAKAVTYEHTHRLEKPPAAGFVAQTLKAARAALEEMIDGAFGEFVQALASKQV